MNIKLQRRERPFPIQFLLSDVLCIFYAVDVFFVGFKFQLGLLKVNPRWKWLKLKRFNRAVSRVGLTLKSDNAGKARTWTAVSRTRRLFIHSLSH